MGKSRTRIPVAWYTALAIAAAVPDRPEQMLVYFTTADVPESKLADLAAEIR